MIHRWRYRVLGGHTHIRVFYGISATSLGKCGDLVYRNEEWKEVQPALERVGIQCLEENDEHPSDC